MASGLLIAGTDTGVGKTRVACALLRACVRAGVRAVGMKPVMTGAHEPGNDVEALALAGNVEAPRAARNPFAFVPAIAPHLAAAKAATRIDIGTIVTAYRALEARAERIVVEAAGGVLVPLDRRTDMLDIAVALDIPVLLVVGMRLGAINHALLSALALRARGACCLGWVANAVDPGFDASGSIATLAERFAAPLLATMSWNDADPPCWDRAVRAWLGSRPAGDGRNAPVPC